MRIVNAPNGRLLAGPLCIGGQLAAQQRVGGHFAARDKPQLFSEEIRDAFRTLR